jgi:hypothetical protein
VTVSDELDQLIARYMTEPSQTQAVRALRAALRESSRNH